MISNKIYSPFRRACSCGVFSHQEVRTLKRPVTENIILLNHALKERGYAPRVKAHALEIGTKIEIAPILICGDDLG
jgi:hypothetical protein